MVTLDQPKPIVLTCLSTPHLPCLSCSILGNAVQVRVPSIVIHWTTPSREMIGSEKWQYLNLWMSNLNEVKI